MKLKINGKDVSIGSKETLAELLTEKGLHPDRVVVEHNLKIVPKEEWHKTALGDNDTIEIVSFVGGG